MKTNTISAGGVNVVVIGLGVLAAALAFMVLTGRKVPLLNTDRASLIAMVVIGMVICSNAGIGRVAASKAWLHPFSIIGYLLGAIIIIIGIAALFGKNLPPLANYYQSFAAVTGIAVIKLILTTIHRIFL